MHDLAFQDVGRYHIRVGVPSPLGLLVVEGRDHKPIGRMKVGKVVVLAGELPAAAELPGWIYPDPLKFVEEDRRAFCPIPNLQVIVEGPEENWDWKDPKIPVAFVNATNPEIGLAHMRAVAHAYIMEVLEPHFQEVCEWDQDHPGHPSVGKAHDPLLKEAS